MNPYPYPYPIRLYSTFPFYGRHLKDLKIWTRICAGPSYTITCSLVTLQMLALIMKVLKMSFTHTLVDTKVFGKGFPGSAYAYVSSGETTSVESND